MVGTNIVEIITFILLNLGGFVAYLTCYHSIVELVEQGTVPLPKGARSAVWPLVGRPDYLA